ncbi:MAG: S-layer homology domain-containing protein, partial [Oscillibacter sp.]|nr:S-layer homology domain-containing protein [Oscillibacter sp.]
ISSTDGTDETPFIESDNPDDPDTTPLISAVDEPEESAVVNPFEDVAEDSPFLAGILYAVEKGITNGTSAKTFSPYAICTHAQIITFLWRGWGSPKPTVENPFPDNIKTNAYYYQAALWAYEKGMVDASFDPYAYYTRLQAVTYMWKLPGAPTVSQAAVPFTDVPDNADARNAVAWAVSHEITNGTSTTTFSPDKRCTRAQIVTFIYRARGLTSNP